MLERLRAAAGPAAVLDGRDAARFAIAGVLPAAVVLPDSAARLAATLALCSAEGWGVEPAGGGTCLHAGPPPAAPPVVVSTARLDTIEAYEPADLVLGAGAGVTLDSLAAATAAHRQLLPFDPPARVGATLGGVAATGAAGPLRHAFGVPRDLVTGLQIATGDGRLLRFGGRVVKNVAGYDLVRLIVGARGALGIVTSLFVRVRPAPDRDETWAVSCADDELVDLTAAIDGTLAPAAIEYLDRGLAGGSNATLWVRFAANQETVRWAGAALRRMAPRAARLDMGDATERWSALGRAEGAARLSVRLTARPAHTAALWRAATELAAAIDANIKSGNESGVAGRFGATRVAAHAADGIVRVWAVAPGSGAAAGAATAEPGGAGDPVRGVRAAIDGARAAVAALGGSLVVVSAPAAWGDAAFHFGEPPDGAALMRSIRARFDPAAILVRGRTAW